jgi:LytS/YehU family sensor histidine kinase
LKKDEKAKDIPVIFVTGNSSGEDEEQGFALGAVDYITKPFRTNTVRIRVRTHINLHFRQIELETISKAMQEQNEKLKRVLLEEKLSTEMAFLKSKINPHFLFNVLNSFYAKSLKHNVPELADGIAKLAELMRYMVYETNEDKVPLEKEIHHLKNFIQVYQLRIADEDEVYINFKIEGNVKGVPISPMLLIPFVENAIKHGIDPKTKSLIDISLGVEQNILSFKVTNTIHQGITGLTNEPSGFGLDNLKKRLSILYPNAHTLETKEENYRLNSNSRFSYYHFTDRFRF